MRICPFVRHGVYGFWVGVLLLTGWLGLAPDLRAADTDLMAERCGHGQIIGLLDMQEDPENPGVVTGPPLTIGTLVGYLDCKPGLLEVRLGSEDFTITRLADRRAMAWVWETPRFLIIRSFDPERTIADLLAEFFRFPSEPEFLQDEKTPCCVSRAGHVPPECEPPLQCYPCPGDPRCDPPPPPPDDPRGCPGPHCKI